MNQDKNMIPKGMYCYTHTGKMKTYKRDGKTFKFPETKPCPYWSVRKGKHKQENGYCSYLKKGDWEVNAEMELYDPKTKKVTYPAPVPIGLLWDQVKECRVNEWTDKDWREMIKDGRVTTMKSKKKIIFPKKENMLVLRKHKGG